MCLKSYRIDSSGLSQVKSHLNNLSSQVSKSCNQQTLGISNKKLQAKKSTFSLLSLSSEDAVVNAESWETVDKNYSFSSCPDHSRRFKEMFPYLLTSKSYKKVINKNKVSIMFGVVPYVQKVIKEGICGVPPLKNPMKQQRPKLRKNATALCLTRYWFKLSDQVSSSCCGSLYVGHCSSENMLDFFYHFKNDLQPETAYL